MPLETPEMKAAYLALRAAAEKGDAKAMMRLAPLAPKYVMVNVARSAIQLKTCSGDEVVVASLRVSDGKALAALASRLEIRANALANAEQ